MFENFPKPLLLLLLLLSLACQTPKNGPKTVNKVEPTPSPLKINLSDGQPVDRAGSKNKTVEGTPIPPEEVAKLLKMFEAPLPKPKDRPQFLKRAGSLPAPRTASVKEMPFPHDGAGAPPPTVKASELKVLSIAPDGAVEHAPRVSISFNSPMTEVSDPTAAEGGDPLGITLEPKPEGKWRWLGTQTLIFEAAKGQLPRATEYKVTVPKGIKDVNGATTTEASSKTFSLPRPAVVSSSPTSSGLPLEPIVRVSFNQPVDPKTTPSKVHLKRGSTELELESLTVGQVDKLESGTSKRYQEQLANTVFFFKARQPLKPGNSYTVEVEKGVKGLEGPLLSDSRWSRTFSTYAPLSLTSTYPRKGKKISPLQDFYLYFNNQLDRKAFQSSWVKAEPAIEDMRVRVQGNHIWILGNKKGNTSYTITVSPNLKDRFKQTLGKQLTVVLKTGEAPETLSHGFSTFTVLDPNAKPSLPVFTTNVERLEVEVHRVTPEDWTAFLTYLNLRQQYRYDNTKPKPKSPGKSLGINTLKIEGERDTLLTNAVDLSDYLDDGIGNLVVTVRDPDEKEKRWPSREFTTWIQGTQVGLDLEVSNDQMLAFVTKLKDGKPLAEAKVSVGQNSAETNAEGIVTLKLPDTTSPICLVTADQGTCFLPNHTSQYGAHNGWRRHSLSPTSRWFLFDDRGLYKPKETVHLKGYVRSWQRGPKGQLTTPGKGGSEVSWSVHDPRGNKIREGKTKVNELGAIEVSFDLPDNTNLGNHQFRLQGGGYPAGHHTVNVQEFRRPEFEVTSTTVSEGPHMLEGTATVKGTAAYYSGGGLAGSDVNWSVSTSASSYTPPGRGEYTFGRWTPWWDLGPWWRAPNQSNSNTISHKGVADGSGSHLLKLEFEKMHPPAPTNVTVTANVADVNRQQRSGSTTILMHPSERYVGLKTDKSFVDEDSDFELEALVTNIDGATLPGIPITVQLFELEYKYGPNGYRQVEKFVTEKELTSSEVSAKFKLSAKRGGSYKVRAEVFDEAGRRNRTEFNLWKAGGKLPSSDKVELESLTLVPTRQEYKPGETARILVMAPFSEGEGMVVWTRDGIEKQERFTLKNGTATVEHPMTEELIPNLRAQITVVGKAKWGDGSRPAVASGSLDLSISTASRKLTVEVLPSRQDLEPGAEIEVEVLVKDHKGQPVSDSEVTLWVADEAILGLVGYKTPAPLASFYGHRPSSVGALHLRTAIRLGKPKIDSRSNLERDLEEADGMEGYDEFAMAPGGYAGEIGGGGSFELRTEFSEQAVGSQVMRRSSGKPMAKGYINYNNQIGALAGGSLNKDKNGVTAIYNDSYGFDIDGDDQPPPQKFTVRKNFDALAIFKGRLATDSKGLTKLKVKLPDSLTRYRVMAVAVEGDQRFGSSDQVLTARLPVQVRPSLPRFLNFGDKASLPVVVQNQTDKPLTVKVIGEAEGVEWIGAAGKQVEVPAKDRVEVRFQAQADQVGKAQFRFGVVAGPHSDASTKTLPVYTPASGEAFATYGSIAKNEAINQPVRRPGEVWTQFGGLQVSMSSTALSELTDAFLYLYAYQFECAEQRSSRMLGIAAMGDVLSAFNPEMMPSKGEIRARMTTDSTHLSRLQNSDGGWQYWRRDNKSVPFVSVHVAHALIRAKAEKYEVKDQTIQRALNYLQNIEQHCRQNQYGVGYTRTITAYALYVRDLAGNPDVNRAKSLFTEITKEKSPNLEALGWLWPTLSKHAKGSAELKELRRLVRNRATQTANSAQFAMSYGEGDDYLILHSSRRTDAILLAGLLGDQPKDQLNTKLVRGLLSHRVKGRWGNTQENIWVLLALQSYFRTYEKETPNFAGKLWLGDTFLGQESFKGRSAKEAQLNVPMAKVPDAKTPLIISKTGPGRLYYRVGMTYAPKSLRLPAESRGFTVERNIKGVDNENDVRQLENGDWTIKAGAKVEVTLTMVAPERRYHVALVDQLAAGLEPLNPVLQGTPKVSNNTGSGRSAGKGWYGWWRWHQHENLRDERVEAFTTLLYPGVYTYTYTALATTPGEYVLPPAKAEEMYSPEIYGRTATGRLIVEK